MSSFRLKLNYAGFRALRKSPEVTAEVRRLAEEVKRATGSPDYEVHESPSKNRARYTVFPTTAEEAAENAKENTLVRALGKVKR